MPSGVGQGGPMTLRKWQQDFIRDIYEPALPDPTARRGSRRIVRRAILSMARKNGKTALIAALVLAHLIGPEAIPNGEIYSAANDRDQAAIIFKFCRQIIELEPQLMQECMVVPSTKTIIGRRTASVYRAVSADAGTKHGYSPTFVVYDELAQAKNRVLYDVLDTSMGSMREPLFAVISTQSNDPEHIMSRLIDDGMNAKDPTIVCHLWAVPEDCDDVFDPKVWGKANPALGDFRSLEDLEAVAAKAQRMPAEEPKFRNLFLNQRVEPVASLISRKEWFGCIGEIEFTENEEVYLGLDMSAVVDLTALVMASASDPTKVLPFFWKPLDLLREHSDRDFGSGNNRYLKWHDDGHLLTTPGRSIDPSVVALKVAELHSRYRVVGLAYDRWRIEDLLREFDRIDLQSYIDKGDGRRYHGLRCVSWGQGFASMAPAVDALERAVVDRKLVHAGNPVLNWNMSNAKAVLDPAGNRKIDKERSIFRIDGAVALTMALGLKARDRSKPAVDVSTMVA